MSTARPGTSLARPGSIQPATTAPKPSVQPYGDFIPIDRTDEYWVSVWSFLRARSAGTARLQVKEYDDDYLLLATTEFAALTAAETKWTRHDLHFGPIAVTGRTAWHANTRWIKVLAFADGTPNLTWEIDAWQVERGPHPTSYAPRPQELVNGQIDRETIADLAIVGPKLADLAITETKIAPDSISTPLLQANAVTAVKIAAASITAEKVAANAIATDNLQAGAINADKIAAGAVEATKIAANAIVTGKIASGTSATGMLVISAADGTTVILDGTSRMYRILYSSTTSLTQAANTAGVADTVLSALGFQSQVPIVFAGISFSSATTGNVRQVGRDIGFLALFAAGSSGGSPTSKFNAPEYEASVGSALQVTTQYPIIRLGFTNYSGISRTAYGTYQLCSVEAL